jgi:hypothetical protein
MKRPNFSINFCQTSKNGKFGSLPCIFNISCGDDPRLLLSFTAIYLIAWIQFCYLVMQFRKCLFYNYSLILGMLGRNANTCHLAINLSVCNVMLMLNCYVWIHSIHTTVQLWMFLRFLLLVHVLLKILFTIKFL